MSDVPLFPGFEPPPVVEPDRTLSAGQRLTIRKQQAITNGVHPLTGGKLHPEATTKRHAPIPGHPDCHPEAPCSGRRDPFTCGSCVHRIQKGWPKCQLGPQGHSAHTDVRAWWPACVKYEAVDPDATKC